jgi:hypothetical protein
MHQKDTEDEKQTADEAGTAESYKTLPTGNDGLRKDGNDCQTRFSCAMGRCPAADPSSGRPVEEYRQGTQDSSLSGFWYMVWQQSGHSCRSSGYEGGNEASRFQQVAVSCMFQPARLQVIFERPVPLAESGLKRTERIVIFRSPVEGVEDSRLHRHSAATNLKRLCPC